MKLHILTPVSRRANLPMVIGSATEAQANANLGGRQPLLEVEWHIKYDDKREHVGGWGLRNQMLDEIPDESHDWVWLLDDDTLAHPHVLAWFRNMVNSERDMFLFAQTRPDGWDPGCSDPARLSTTAGRGGHVDPGKCAFDAGQAIFRRRVLGPYRFVEGDHASDGYLWSDVLAQVPHDRIAWTPQVLGFYNALRPA